jgi:SH3-like domain-containing protein
MFGRIKSIKEHSSGIIMTPSVNARSSPDEQSTNVFVLHEGTKVMIRDSVQNWKEIKIANGNTGWIPAEALEEI